MIHKIRVHILCALFCVAALVTGCNTTRHLEEGEYLLKSNSVNLKSNEYVTRRGEITDNLSSIIVQQPNSYFLLPIFPYKLWLYNLRYDKYQADTLNYQIESRTVEKPVLYDSSTIPTSKQYMQSYLFQQGYFYAQIDDTTIFKKKKAFVKYDIETGINYLINIVDLKGIEDPEIARIIKENFIETHLRKGKPYSAQLVEQERSRLTNLLRTHGFYYFSNDNITFELDTANKQYLKDKESTIETAINLIALQEGQQQKPTLDIYVNIVNDEEGKAFKKYGINRVRVYPDFKDRTDYRNPNLLEKKVEKVTFRYHKYWVREKVIHNHMFIIPETYFDQNNYDKTVTELNQLGIFSSVQVNYYEDTSRKDGGNWLSCGIMLTPADLYDVGTSWEASSGTTYTLGTGLTVTQRSRNVGKGANLLTVSLSGGVENQLNNDNNKLYLITKTAGANVSFELPKFLFPIGKERYSIRNVPRTEFAVGGSLLDRTNFFTLVNVSSRFTYKWQETKTKSWEVTPAFVNNIRLPYKSPSFIQLLDTNDFLKNTYRETFIEGENIAWVFSNGQFAKLLEDYSYIRLSLEEAGGVASGVNRLFSDTLNPFIAQYLKFDFDLRHYFKQRHSTTAVRLYGGVGMPYGKSITLPYLKQYFVGGPFSMRGWRVRTLGPGSYTDTTETKDKSNTNVFIDRTGDIKLEFNAEYRFNLFHLFGDILNFNGAAFTDVGNMWLANPSTSYPNGEFRFNRLYTDLAVSGGAGLRVDIASIFLLRLDLAIPLKVPGNLDIPSLGIKQGWVLDDIALGRSDWRQKNVVVNIAVGYPF